ncbi:LicD family protein [Methanobrevibacter sp.]
MENNEKTKDCLKFDDETLNHLRDVEIMILKDFIEICTKHDIEYYGYAGTALGAVRHEGFIPWDDDIDVALFRKDYEKFLEIVKEEYSDKYDFICMENYDNYFIPCLKMSLKGTKRHESYLVNMGIHIDIYTLEFASSNKIKWYFEHKKAIFLKKYAYLLTVVIWDKYSTKPRKLIGTIIKNIFKLLNITNKTYLKLHRKLIVKKNDNYDMVYVLESLKPYPKDAFKPSKKTKFESIMINIPNNNDLILKIAYGDYMKLPPEEERFGHFCKIDFGEY